MSTPDASDTRTRARQQGLNVSDRGRLPQDIVTAYEQAHAKRKSAQVAPVQAAKPSRSTVPRTLKAPLKASARPTTTSSSSKAQLVAPKAPADGLLEKRVAELEKQVLSLTERLDAAVTASTTRSRSFSLPTRK